MEIVPSADLRLLLIVCAGSVTWMVSVCCYSSEPIRTEEYAFSPPLVMMLSADWRRTPLTSALLADACRLASRALGVLGRWARVSGCLRSCHRILITARWPVLSAINMHVVGL